METTSIDYNSIPGWATDVDPQNEPTYPIKHYTGDDHNGLNWERPPLQEVKVEMLKSNERPSLSAVFGTTLPPKGLSGVIRRYAFKHSENRLRHWLALIMADRVNVIEGYLSDFAHGRFPNIYKECGWNALRKFSPARLFRKIASRVVILTAIILAVYYISR
jgi:hypothetical protein